jgi:hypothetical protein
MILICKSRVLKLFLCGFPQRSNPDGDRSKRRKFEQKAAKVTKGNQDWVRGFSRRHSPNSLLARVTFDEPGGNRSKRRKFEQKEAKVTKRDQDWVRGWSLCHSPNSLLARVTFDELGRQQKQTKKI